MPKSEQEKAEIRRRTEANRQPGKDRSAHEAARGKKMKTLSELSRELPSKKNLLRFLDILAEEPSDRSAAIMAAGLCEQALLEMINTHMPDVGATARKEWFEGASAPFATFSAKIKLGRALAIYGPKTEDRLTRIKDIRNVFAHRSSPIKFTHPTIKQEVAKLAPPTPMERGIRVRYGAVCFGYARTFIDIAHKNAGTDLILKLP